MSRLQVNGLLIEYGDGKPANGEIRETAGCRHCQRTVLLKEADAKWAYCHRCNSLICGWCFTRGGCQPWEEMLAREEAKFESRRSMGLT